MSKTLNLNYRLSNITLKKSIRIKGAGKSVPALYFEGEGEYVTVKDTRKILNLKKSHSISFAMYGHIGGGWYVKDYERIALKRYNGVVKIGCQYISLKALTDLREFIKGFK